MVAEQFTQFDYLLNAMTEAGRHEKPADHGYGEKRRKLYEHVRELERKAALADLHPCVRAEPELLHLAETCELWARQVSEQPDVRHGIRDAGAKLAQQLRVAIARHVAGVRGGAE